MRLNFKWVWFIVVALFSQAGNAYDPCDVKFALGTVAANKCFRIPHQLENSAEKFEITAVMLTKDLATAEDKTDIVLVPGGPGTDSQAIAMSLNKNRMLDALWAHMNVNVILWDPRGTGHSLLPKSAEFYDPSVFSTKVQVQDLQKVIDTVSPNKPVYLLAHSAGGDLAARFAALYPKRVKGLILYSASIDTREIGESNLRIYAREFAHFDRHLATCPTAVATELKEQQTNVEIFLRNVLKLQRIANTRPSKLQSRFHLKDFRVQMITAIENDPTCTSRIPEVLETWQMKIENLPVEIKTAVNEMSEISFDEKTNVVPVIKRGTWIKTAVICSEGITKKEMKQELWLEGINFSQDTCKNVTAFYETPPSRDWLSLISAPTLLIGGTEDPFQVPSAVARNAKAIKNSETVMIPGGGHESHLIGAMQFYNAIEKFLAKH